MARIYYDEDSVYLRSLEEERNELVSPLCEYYSLNLGINVDPLNNEPVNDPLFGGSSPRGSDSRSNKSWNFYPDLSKGQSKITFPCAIEYMESENRTPSIRPEGFIYEYDAIVGIARNHWETALSSTPISSRKPKEGDVIYLFNEWWDIVKAGKGGYVLDSTEYVGFKLELKKKTQFTPDRKVSLT